MTEGKRAVTLSSNCWKLVEGGPLCPVIGPDDRRRVFEESELGDSLKL